MIRLAAAAFGWLCQRLLCAFDRHGPLQMYRHDTWQSGICFYDKCVTCGAERHYGCGAHNRWIPRWPAAAH